VNVFVLGGYGKVGLPAAKLLAQSERISAITVAAGNLERAKKAVEEIGQKATVVNADITDEKELTELLVDYDIIVNAATEKAVLPAIRAATRTTGTDYCDVTSFGDFVEQVLPFGAEAKAAGITAIIANGISPGISNLMGVFAARQLDGVEQLQLIRAEFIDFPSGRDLTPLQWREEPEQSLKVLHQYRPFVTMMFRMLQKNGTRTILDYQDGQWVKVDPIMSGLQVPHLHGGIITSYPYASCDSFWGALPRDLGTVSPVEVWFSPLPAQFDAMLRDQALAPAGRQCPPRYSRQLRIRSSRR
jgi:saccharopine dehydrogenase-like NADP-dependent oxidoreductase